MLHCLLAFITIFWLDFGLALDVLVDLLICGRGMAFIFRNWWVYYLLSILCGCELTLMFVSVPDASLIMYFNLHLLCL